MKTFHVTVKSLFRSSTIILAVVGGILLMTANGYSFTRTDISGKVFALTWVEFAAASTNHVVRAITGFLPAFLGIVAGFGLLRDRDNSYSDIQKASQMSFKSYYLSKLLAFTFVGFIGALTIILISCVVQFLTTPAAFNESAWKVIVMYLIRMGFVFTGGIFTYLSIAVFFSALSGKCAVGAIASISYSLFSYLFPVFFNARNFVTIYLYKTPYKILSYLYYWGTERQGIPVMVKSSLGDAILTLGIQLAMALALLTAGGILLKRKMNQ